MQTPSMPFKILALAPFRSIHDKDNFKKDLEPLELQEGINRAFSLFWKKMGHWGPENLGIWASQPGPDNRIFLRISLKPSRQILPTGEKIEMEFV